MLKFFAYGVLLSQKREESLLFGVGEDGEGD